MQVLLISSSPHKEKSSTFLLANEVLCGLNEEGITTETIHLDNFRVFFCKHCEACHKLILKCLLKDDVGSVFKHKLKSSLIVTVMS